MFWLFKKIKFSNIYSDGFTLIELLVVIAVIGIMSSMVLVSLGPVRDKARDARRQSDLRQINLAMEMCFDDNSCETASNGGSERYFQTIEGADTVAQIGRYLNPVPEDPSGAALGYVWTANDASAQYYCVYAALQGEVNTYVCSSNKGVLKKDGTGGAFTACTADTAKPCNVDCCGVNVTN